MTCHQQKQFQLQIEQYQFFFQTWLFLSHRAAMTQKLFLSRAS